MRFATSHTLVRRLAGAAAASGLALAGLVVAAAPASAAACSGTSGVTVVVDTGGSISTRCASGDPSSAWKALTGAGFGATPVSSFPGALCQINGYPDTSCVRMPPADAYWAFFHAKRGGSWTYSSSGVASYDPAPGTVVGFRFGSGQQPGIAPPAPTKTTEPAPTKSTTKPPATTAAPKPTVRTSTSTSGSTSASGAGTGSTPEATTSPASPSASPSATASASPSTSASASPSSSTSASATPLAAEQTSGDGDDGSSGLGTLLLGGALVALVAGGAGWAAWRRRA